MSALNVYSAPAFWLAGQEVAGLLTVAVLSARQTHYSG